MEGSGNSEVKLLGAWSIPFTVRARIALNLKGVQYEYVDEKFREKSELLLKCNPVYKKIPILIHQGKPVCESMIIVQYIDETWTGSGPSLMPQDAYERALHRFWAVYVDDKWFPALSRIMGSQTEEAKVEAKEEALAGLQLLEEAFRECSKGKSFFGGDTIGYLDIALGSFLGWLKVMMEITGVKFLDNSETPFLTEWAEKFCNEEAVKAVLPETAIQIEVFKTIQARVKAAQSSQ